MNFFKKIYNNSVILNRVRYLISASIIKRRGPFFCFDDSNFLRINLGCKGKAFYSYVNIDEKRTKGRVFVSNFTKLPFKSKSVKVIVLDYNSVKHKKEKNICSIVKELARVMVRAGILRIDNFNKGNNFVKLLEENGFVRIGRAYSNLYSAANFIFSSSSTAKKEWPKLYYETNNKTIDVTIYAGEKKNIFCIEKFDLDINMFDKIYLQHVLEFVPTEKIEYFLSFLKDRINEKTTLAIEVINEQIDNNNECNFFDKANLAQLVTEAGFLIQRLELKDNSIYMEIKKKGIFIPISARKKRICAIGQYLMFRYNHLGFEWDSIPRAFEQLGMDYLLIEGMRNQSIKEMQEAILSFRPNYLLIILKETMPIIYEIKSELKKMGTKVIFWFMDPVYPHKEDLSEVVNFMFLSNRGQIGAYKKAYNLDKVFYMPQGIGEYTMYHRDALKEIYDIGFSGAISKEPLHETRRELIRKLKLRYNVKVRNNVRNNLAEFYSQSRVVFGASDFDHELYTSNRFFVALGCGACYLTKKFTGIELLVRNREHVLWFESEEGLFDIADFYLNHDRERNMLRQNAQRLAHQKHTCVNRIKNILDIVNGKTESFYGFL